jgi:type IV secretion system protein VirB5
MITSAKNIVVTILLLILSSAVFAQIPVTVTSDIPGAMNQVATMAKWAAQFQQMTQQIDRMKDEYAAITGNRGLGQVLNNPSLRNYLPDEWANIYDQVRSGKLAGISGQALSILSTEGFDLTATGGQKRQQDVLAANKAMTMQAYNATLARLKNINALMLQADATQDMKAAADLQNRMAAENAMIHNEQTRLILMTQLEYAESKLADEQQKREFKAKYFK